MSEKVKMYLAIFDTESCTTIINVKVIKAKNEEEAKEKALKSQKWDKDGKEYIKIFSLKDIEENMKQGIWSYFYTTVPPLPMPGGLGGSNPGMPPDPCPG